MHQSPKASPVTLPLTNSWVAYGGQYKTPTFQVQNGICIVEGLARSGGWGTLAQLPSECRPSKRLIFNLNNHEASSRVDVAENGTVSWHAGGKSHTWISLSGIAFASGSGAQALPVTHS